MKIVASIEARMTSSRLPGKVLMTAAGTPLLEIMVRRVLKSKLVDDVIVATTVNKEDVPIVELCKKNNFKYFCGSELDVLERVLLAHKYMNTDIIVQLTGDCPLIDPYIIDETIKLYKSKKNLGFASSVQVPIRQIPDGMDVLVFRLNDLINIEKTHKEDSYREHTSLGIEKEFLNNNLRLIMDKRFQRNYFLRITLDNKFDYELIKNVHEELFYQNEDYGLEDILIYFDKNKEVIMSKERFE